MLAGYLLGLLISRLKQVEKLINWSEENLLASHVKRKAFVQSVCRVGELLTFIRDNRSVFADLMNIEGSDFYHKNLGLVDELIRFRNDFGHKYCYKHHNQEEGLFRGCLKSYKTNLHTLMRKIQAYQTTIPDDQDCQQRGKRPRNQANRWKSKKAESIQLAEYIASIDSVIRETKELEEIHHFKTKRINRTQGYHRHTVDDRGDCGYDAFGITRQDAVSLLIDELAGVRDRIIPVAHQALLENAAFRTYLRTNHYIADNVTDETLLRDIAQYAGNDQVLRGYLQYDVRDRAIDAGWAHPAILQAIAQLQGLELRLWVLGEQQVLLPHRHADHYDYHALNLENPIQRVDLLFVNGNHFERLDLIGYTGDMPTANIYPIHSEGQEIEINLAEHNSCQNILQMLENADRILAGMEDAIFDVYEDSLEKESQELTWFLNSRDNERTKLAHDAISEPPKMLEEAFIETCLKTGRFYSGLKEELLALSDKSEEDEDSSVESNNSDEFDEFGRLKRRKDAESDEEASSDKNKGTASTSTTPSTQPVETTLPPSSQTTTFSVFHNPQRTPEHSSVDIKNLDEQKEQEQKPDHSPKSPAV